MNTTDSPPIVERMLFRDRNENIVLRVVGIDDKAQQIWLCRIDDDSWPYPMPKWQLLEDLHPEKGRFEIDHNDPWAQPGIASKTGTAAEDRKKKRFSIIQPLISDGNERLMFFKSTRRALIAKVRKEAGCSRQTITALYLQYLKRGMTSEALRTDYAHCGAPGKKRNPTGKKVGMTRTITPGKGVNVDEKMRKILRIAADFYFSRKKPTLQEALDYIVRLYFSKRIKDENGRVVAFEVEPDAKPTVRQLQYFIKTNYSNRYIRRRRDGQKNWDLNERELLGTSDGDVQGPGDLFQIDATVADVYLVSQFDRRRIVGRPILYLVVDVFSRLIVGMYVGFEGPSWIGAMMALVNTVTPKIEFCKQYEIDIDESDWPSHYAPKRIMGDRGELMSVALGENITESLHIDIENASTGRADLKAMVERRFGIVPAKFMQFTPGYVQKDFNERGSADYRLQAALTLPEFTQQVIYAVCEHNFTPIRGIRLPADMVTDGLSAAPIDLWQWGIANRSGSLKALTVEEVELNVMPPEDARVTAAGIHFKGCYYSCDTALREEWFAKARRQEWPVKVSFDPRNMDNVYLRDPKLPHGFEACRLLDRSHIYSGKSLFEIEELELAKKKTEAAGENDRQAKRILFDQQMAQIEKKAKKATKAVADPDTPKSKRVAGIRDNRADEKEIQRGAEQFDLTDTMEKDQSVTPSKKPRVPRGAKTFIDDTLSIFEKNRKEREGKKHEK